MMAAKRSESRRPSLRQNEPMALHTSWRVGGAADLYFRPQSEAELVEFLAGVPAETPVLWTGLGSNLLVRDGGIRGAVINTSRVYAGLERLDGDRVAVGAGVPCTALARKCARWGLGPAAFFAGIPGTIGGALVMNAGAFGGETWDRIIEVDTIDRQGKRRTRAKSDFDIGYRHVERPRGEWFTRALFQFEAQSDDVLARVNELMEERKEKQPLGLPSCGSVFRNPEGGHAAELIESCGLKGKKIGGAQVSNKHANFIINADDATAADIETLIEHVRETVLARRGVALELEVHIVGEAQP